MVLDDAVVHQRQAASVLGVIPVRVGVLVARFAVGGPAGVGDAECAIEVISRTQPFLEHADPADGSLDFHPAIHHRHARRVVPPVFESLEPLDEKGAGLLVPDVGDDAAHDPKFS